MKWSRESRNKPIYLQSTDFNLCAEKWISACKRMTVDPYLIPHTKINSKWIKDLRVKPKTIKLIGENVGLNFMTLYLAVIYLVVTPKAQKIKAKIHKRD